MERSNVSTLPGKSYKQILEDIYKVPESMSLPDAKAILTGADEVVFVQFFAYFDLHIRVGALVRAMTRLKIKNMQNYEMKFLFTRMKSLDDLNNLAKVFGAE